MSEALRHAGQTPSAFLSSAGPVKAAWVIGPAAAGGRRYLVQLKALP
ncbi:MAG: hypothetical protein ABI379_12965 [Rhodanobacter sp.]